MSDMTSTWILRAFLWIVIVPLGAMFVVVVIDGILEVLIKEATGHAYPRFIEVSAFWAVVFLKTWDWLTNRVWVG